MKKKKYLQIFNYLLEYSKLRGKAVKNIEAAESQYPHIIWFANIPQYDIFDCITFPNFNQDAEYWIKINKPKVEPQRPSFPKLSAALNDWIEKDSLLDENGMPVLKKERTKDEKTILLSDHPQIEIDFQNYINNKWIDDLEFYKTESKIFEGKFQEYSKQSDIYKHFFTIYNKAQQFGEEYELIIGVGLLYFRENEDTPLICRHILTSKAEITFEFSQRESFIKVNPSIENEIQIETDAILDLFAQFESSDIIEAERKVSEFIKEKNISDNPFDKQIAEAIQIFSDRLRPDSQFKPELNKSKEIPVRPTVFMAPALILRKRNSRSFTTLYEKIISDISVSDDDIDIPSINEIIGYLQESEDFSEDSIEENSLFSNNDTIYFPKKYNEEQIEIIQKANKNNKVLVQGPPGTGKSHTIANLICHLLANGKKVLVTAFTKRALEVLQKQLPDDFQNLAVNLLSSDSDSIQGLESSVNTINDELSRITNFADHIKEIEERESELSSIKEQKAYTKNEWLKVKEKSTRVQTLNKNYKGTLIEIAEKLEKESLSFNWFKDELSDINEILLIAEIDKFIELKNFYQNFDCSSFDFIIPDKERILSISELKEYRKITNDLLQKYSSDNNHIVITCRDFQELKNQLELLCKLFLEIENSVLPFKSKLISDYKSNLVFWKDKLTSSNNSLAELPDEKLKHFDKNVEIKYPDGKSWIQLKNDANTLLAYLNEGNSLSGLLFNLKKALLPKNIKEKLYFINAVTVNGSPCDKIDEFETVLTDIKIKQGFEELESIWEIGPNDGSKFYFDRAKFYKQLIENTAKFISIIDEANKLKTYIASISSLNIPNYESDFINKLINETNYNFVFSQSNAYKEKISEANKYLSIQNIHPVSNIIKKAFANVDIDTYEQLISDIDTIISEKNNYNIYLKLKRNLRSHFPNLIDEILDDTFDFSKFCELENAICYKHAFTEISKLLEEDYEKKLTCKLDELEKREEKLISIIASKKAWAHVFASLELNPNLKKDLSAFALFAKKSKGSGKKALKFRRDTQVQMHKCKGSVPCWIMPLYKVAETINPEREMYDYVIIDEASQLGADALFLLYISKKIIIVGDDKQISPENVGVLANAMTPYVHKHLKDIPHASCFEPEFSFFDYAKIFCNGMTVLREHFRCMPEIIEFSNKYFYAPDGKGLYPLKQYSETRIPPLKTFYCKNGFTEGTYQNITNKIEAESIADEIAKLVHDENYYKVEDGIKVPKSIGVIALQGNKQASLIETLILKKITEADFKRRNIVCGNSASFQGDERDIMFLSLVTANNHNRAALVKPEDERRFNVAASRAKEQIWLFHSVQIEDLSNTNDLRYKLLDHFINFKPPVIPLPRNIERTLSSQPEPFESWFEVDVYNDIVSKGYTVIPQYEVAKGKYRIDLVSLLSNGIKIAIECDGDKYHGPEQFQNDLMRQKVLERCGWQFFRVRGAEYYSNRIKALEPLWKILKSNDAVSEISTASETKPVNGNANTAEPSIVNQPLSDSNEQSKLKVSNDPNLYFYDEFLVFTNSQIVHKLQNKGYTETRHILENINFSPDKKPIFITGTSKYIGYLIIGFENGKVAKIPLKSYETQFNRKKLINAYGNLSKLIFIENILSDIDLIAVSSNNKIVLFNTGQMNPIASRTTSGVQVIKINAGDTLTEIRKLDQVKFKNPDYYRKKYHHSVHILSILMN